MFINNNKNTNWRRWRRSFVFIDNYKHFTPFFSVSIADFEQIIVSWEWIFFMKIIIDKIYD